MEKSKFHKFLVLFHDKSIETSILTVKKTIMHTLQNF